jgi:hypothetical protein
MNRPRRLFMERPYASALQRYAASSWLRLDRPGAPTDEEPTTRAATTLFYRQVPIDSKQC